MKDLDFILVFVKTALFPFHIGGRGGGGGGGGGAPVGSGGGGVLFTVSGSGVATGTVSENRKN